MATSRDALREIIAGQLADLVRGRAALSDEHQAQRLAEIDQSILQCELGEEAAIRRLEAAGIAIQRRADAHPAAVLAADAALPKPVA